MKEYKFWSPKTHKFLNKGENLYSYKLSQCFNSDVGKTYTKTFFHSYSSLILSSIKRLDLKVVSIGICDNGCIKKFLTEKEVCELLSEPQFKIIRETGFVYNSNSITFKKFLSYDKIPAFSVVEHKGILFISHIYDRSTYKSKVNTYDSFEKCIAGAKRLKLSNDLITLFQKEYEKRNEN